MLMGPVARGDRDRRDGIAFQDREAAAAGRPDPRQRTGVIQKFVSTAMGLLVAADVMSLSVPLYFFGQATDRVGDVFHSVAKLVNQGLADIFDQIEAGSIAVSDALYLVWTAILVGAGFVFLRA